MDPPLHTACWNGNLNITEILTHVGGADINKVSGRFNRTPLHCACGSGAKEIVHYLVKEAKCDVDVVDEDNQTPLHYACWRGHKDVAKYLVEEVKCAVDVRDKFKKTPLHWACSRGHTDVVVYLTKEAKCDVDVKDMQDKTPLHSACSRGHKDAVAHLVKRTNCAVDVKDMNDQTPLHRACIGGHKDVVAYLAEVAKCDVDAKDKDNQTPVHKACEGGHKDILLYLVEEAKSNINVADKDDKTPLDLALQKPQKLGCIEVANYLKSRSLQQTQSDLHVQPEGTLLTLEDTDALDKLLKDKCVDSAQLSTGNSEVTLERVQEMLLDRGLGELATNLRAKLDEVVGEQRRYLERLEDLMTDENTIKIQYLKLFLVGPPFVGKTTTLNRLLKEIENILSAGDKGKIPSTLLANCTQVLAFVKENEAKWLCSKDLNEEARLLFGYLYKNKASDFECIEHSQQTSPVSQTPEHLKNTVKQQNHVEVTPKQEISDPTPPMESSVTSSTTPEQTLPASQQTTTSITKVTAVIRRLRKLIINGDYSKLFSLLGSTLLNVNDVGGQPGFLEMLPALISGPAMYLLFFNLSKDLDRLYKIPFSREDTTITPYDAKHTVEATISQLLSAIASVHCISHEPAPFRLERAERFSEKFEQFRSVRPVATLIGTHKDQMKGNLQHLHETLKMVTDKFSDIVVNPNKETSFFAVDNLQGTEDLDLAPIRAHMHRLFDTHFRDADLPVRPAWLMFSIILRKEYCIISMEECLEIGKALNIQDREEVEFCLWYLHHCIGTLMYYPRVPDDEDNWFKNHVICSPQVVFDSISQLIVASLRTLHSAGPCLECDRKDYVSKGQFSIESIQTYCSSDRITAKLDNCELIPVKKLVKLLQYANLLSPIEADKSKLASTSYFMPAVLECASDDELTKPPQPDDNNPAPLLITFDCGYVPTGVFCGLVTRIVSRGPNKIFGLTWDLVQENVKRNCISFHIDVVHKVTLLSHERCYEIRVTRNDESVTLLDLCAYVLASILALLKDLFETLIPVLAFECPCAGHNQANRDLRRLCVWTEGYHLRFICTKKVIPLRKEHQVWIGKHVELGSKECLEVVRFSSSQSLKGLSFHWSKVGNDTELVAGSSKPNVLKFQSVSEDDFGHYQCEVRKGGKPYFRVYRALFKSPRESSSTNDEEKSSRASKSELPWPQTQTSADESLVQDYHHKKPRKDAGNRINTTNDLGLSNGTVCTIHELLKHNPAIVEPVTLKVDYHLQPLKEAIWEVRSQWKEIGRSLGLTDGDIRAVHEVNDGECLHEVLSIWIQTGKATIYSLLKSLENVTVGRIDIADQIRNLR